MAIITEKNVQNFVWKSIVCCLGTLRVFIFDNKKHFDNDAFRYYSSPAHPQANDQVEVTRGAKGIWPDKTIAQTPTGETPLKLAFGSETIIPSRSGACQL